MIPVNSQHPEVAAIQQAALAIQQGKLVAFPTETVYGLGANALDPEAISRIFAAKGRPSTNPLIVHLAHSHQLDRVAVAIPELAWQLFASFAPGPLTLILQRHPCVPDAVSSGLPTIAVRVPSHPVAQALLTAATVPIAAPSANRSNRPSPTTATHVLDDLQGQVDVVLDGGATPIGVESTVLDLTSNPPRLLRPGSLPVESLREVLPTLDYQHYPISHQDQFSQVSQVSQNASRNGNPDVSQNNAFTPSPGMSLKHYAPAAQFFLFQGEQQAVLAAMLQVVAPLIQAGKRFGLLLVDEDATYLASQPALATPHVKIITLGRETDATTIAQRLFSGLRELDRWGAEVILARMIAPEGLGLAIADRLFRAAAGHIIRCS